MKKGTIDRLLPNSYDRNVENGYILKQVKDMKLIAYRIVALAILSSSLVSALGRERYVRIRTIGGMEPIGALHIRGGGTKLKTPMNTGYGLSPGLEIYYVLNEIFEVGIGFQWQFGRKALPGKNTGIFGSAPIYSSTRINLARVEDFSTYALLKLGYSILNSGRGFREIWNSEPGGSLNSAKGGFYGMAALGVTTKLKETHRWDMDLSIDTGYIFQGFTVSNSERDYPLLYHEMSVHFSLDWLF